MKTSIFFAAAVLAFTAPASATTMDLYNGSTAGMINALPGFNGTSANTFNGVMLSTTGTLFSNGNGMSNLTIGLSDITQGFGKVVIGLNANKASPVTITGFATLLDGSSINLPSYEYDYGAVANGSKSFLIQSDADTLFTTLTLTFSNNESQIKGLYVGGTGTLPTAATSPVPEPMTWAMMLAGFAAIGWGMRRKQRPSVRLNFA